ncbi:hypothetical protein N0V82_010428 [Gnomoniopsis sp. IMI 355080]|nr:hypothetical protein N0V82_010428 [Gnomoniopsis sp. IMI 355080]
MFNRQATAACDFCNRKKIPLQKCQDCNINICKTCTSQGTLENDARHMLASEAANSFDWHKWGKVKNTKPLPTLQSKKPTPRIVTPIPEPSAQTVLSQPAGGFSSGYAPAPPDGHPQYSLAPYNYPIPVNYNQYNRHATHGLSPIVYFPSFSQQSAIPQFPHTPPPFGICGAPAGQPIYYGCVPQQPSYGLYSPQIPLPAAELQGPANLLGPVADKWPPQSSQEAQAQSEDVQGLSETSNGHSTTHVTEESLTPGSSAGSKDIHLPGQPSNKEHNTPYLAHNTEKPFVELEKTHKPRQTLEPQKEAVRTLNMSCEGSQSSGQGISKNVSSSTQQPIKKARREHVQQPSERRSRTTSIARVSKRSLQGFGDNVKEDEPGAPPAKKSRRNHLPEARVVKLSVRSTSGVQRLREILGTSKADSRSESVTQDKPQSLASGSVSGSSFSSQAIKRTRLDELLDAAGVQPVPWPPAVPNLSPQMHDKERSRQFPAKSGKFAGYQDSFTGRLDQHATTGDQVDDDEAREAAMILLNMRHGR